MSENNNIGPGLFPARASNNASPVHTSGAFYGSVVRDSGLGIHGTSIQTRDINPYNKQENHIHFNNPIFNFLPPGSRQSHQNQRRPAQTQAYHPQAIEAEHHRQAQDGKPRAGNHKPSQRTYISKHALIVIALGIILSVSLGVGLGLGFSRRNGDQGKDGISSSSQSSTAILSATLNTTLASGTSQLEPPTVSITPTGALLVPPITSTNTTSPSPVATSQPHTASTPSNPITSSTPSPPSIPSGIPPSTAKNTAPISFLSPSTPSRSTITTSITTAPAVPCTCDNNFGCPGVPCSDNNGCCDPFVCLYSTCKYVPATLTCNFAIAGAACPPSSTPCCPGYTCDTSRSQCVAA